MGESLDIREGVISENGETISEIVKSWISWKPLYWKLKIVMHYVPIKIVNLFQK